MKRKIRFSDGKNLIGPYSICGVNINMYWRPGSGGEFTFNSGKGIVPEIVIGFDEPTFDHIIRTVIHELFEFSMTEGSLRWSRSDDWSNSHDGYLFIMTHPQFSDMCGRVGEVLGACLPEIGRLWKEYQKTKGRKG